MDSTTYTAGSRITQGFEMNTPNANQHAHHQLNSSNPYEYMTMESTSPVKIERSYSISPASSSSHPLTSSASSSSSLRCVKKNKFSPYGVNGNPPVAVRRNERERNRVKLVNMGFSTLRQHVPNGAKNKKMSKVETLRSAVDYIRQLQQLLGESSENIRQGNENLESSSPLSVTGSSSLDPYQLPHHVSSSSPSGHEASSSSSTHSPSFETAEVSFQDRERCLNNNHLQTGLSSEEDFISFTKWFS